MTTQAGTLRSPAPRLTVNTNPFALGLLRGRLELKQFFRARTSVIFVFAFPVLLLLIFGTIFKGEIAPGLPFTRYFVSGIVAAGLMSIGFQSLAIQIPIERDRGVLKRLAGTPMPRASYFIGKIVMVLVSGLLETAVLLLVARLFFHVPFPETAAKWLTFAWVSLLGISACTLCGIAFSSVPKEGKQAPSIVTPLALVLQFISGVFFSFSQLPAWMQAVSSLFPLKWMTQGMRAAFLPDFIATQEPGGSWNLPMVALVLAAWVVAAFVLCLATFRWTTEG
jgi:ABC-2 type transport system permease protein